MSDLRPLLHEMLKNSSRYFSFEIHLSLMMSLGQHLKTLLTKVALGAMKKVARRRACRANAVWLADSDAQAPPMLGAPSWMTASIRLPPDSFSKAWQADHSAQPRQVYPLRKYRIENNGFCRLLSGQRSNALPYTSSC